MFDVTVGDNVQVGTGTPGSIAGTSGDAVTGLWTPNAAQLVPALASVGSRAPRTHPRSVARTTW